MKRSVLWVSSVAATMGLIEACGGAAPGSTEPKASMFERGDEPTSASCAATVGANAWARVSLDRQSGAVVLARSGKRTFALAADEDSQAIHTVDVDTQQSIASTFVGASPAQLMMLADGRVAVTLRDKAELAIYEPTSDPAKPLRHRCSVKTPAEPLGMALTNDDSGILVVGGWSARLTEYASADLKQGFQVELPRDPRAVLVDESGTRAFVSHVVGSELSVIDLGGKHEVRDVDMKVRGQAPNRASADGKFRTGSQGFALVKAVVETPGTTPNAEKPVLKGQAPKPAAPKGRIFVPMVTVSPGDPEQRSQAYYGESVDGLPKESPIVNVIDASAERSLTKSKVGLNGAPADECLLPRAAAYRTATDTLLVACAGINQVLELNTAGTDPSRLISRRVSVPSGPMGIALDEQNKRAVVWSQFDASVSVIDLSTDIAETVRIAVDYRPTPSAFAAAAGRELFHTTDDSRISNDGVACASCHPDGRDDSLTWSTPEGPRQTIMLAGRTPGTAPYGWVGKHGDLKTYIKNTFSRLGGRGLPSRDLDALAGYLDTMPGPSTAGWTEVADQKLVAQGRELFMNEKQGCASCHNDAATTDKTVHDVGSRAKADLDGKFDTPSLVSIRGTAPYFHDGRYKSLDDMLSATDSEMGHTAHLSQQDRSALKAFLGGL